MKKLLILFIALFLTSALFAQEAVTGFHNFAWGTSFDAFKARMGNPVYTEEINGFQSYIYENIYVSGYYTFMIVYFSASGLEGGTYYFYTINQTELTVCFTTLQRELMTKFGPTIVYEPEVSGTVPMREMRVYESSWKMPGGYVYLKVNTRGNNPIALWFSSPELTRRLHGS